MAPTILFLCTGNYYRSRFAELRFNHLAPGNGLPHVAASRGLRIDVEQKHNKGPLAADTIAACQARAMRLPGPESLPMPMPVTEADFAAALRVIALHDDEHRPMMLALHPAWADRTEYWDIVDVPPSEAYDPLALIDARVAALIDGLRGDAPRRAG